MLAVALLVGGWCWVLAVASSRWLAVGLIYTDLHEKIYRKKPGQFRPALQRSTLCIKFHTCKDHIFILCFAHLINQIKNISFSYPALNLLYID